MYPGHSNCLGTVIVRHFYDDVFYACLHTGWRFLNNIFAESGFFLANNDDVLHYKKMAYLKGQCHKILDPPGLLLQ